MALYDTVANIVSDAAVELGLGSVSNVFTSTDPNVVQLRGLLRSEGRQLVLDNDWIKVKLEHTFTTTNKSSYDLPADFSRMVGQSGWNRTSQRPLAPVTPQQWQRLKARDSSTVFAALFRPGATTLELWPQPPTPGETVAFEYLSRYWLSTSSTTDPSKDAPTANADVVHIDGLLMTRALKFAFLRAKGFDSTAAQADFELTFASVRSAAAAAAPTLSMVQEGPPGRGSGLVLPSTVGGE